MIGLCTAMIGMILIVALPLTNNSGRLAGYYLTQASPTPFVALLSLISSNVAGYTKKTTVAAMYLIGYCAGNIIGEQICLAYADGSGHAHTTSRSANLPSERRTAIRASRDHYHCMLGRVLGYTVFHPLLLRVAEQEEGSDTCIARVRASREPRVSHGSCLGNC
jgi:hypothetical protein